MTALASAEARPTTGSAVLATQGLTRRFGGVTAVSGLDLEVRSGEVVGVIGPNGAGKSTLVGLISGQLTPSEGRVVFDGVDISARGAADRARLGIGRTHQIPRPFERMTVLENLLLAADAVDRRRSAHDRESDCRNLLGEMGLAASADRPAGSLTLLQRKRLELARALALEPRVIMLDEIGAGLVEHETAELIGLIRSLRERVDAAIVIEHVMDVITSCCERTVVLDLGVLIADGPTPQVLADPIVAAAYLGSAAGDHAAGAHAAGAHAAGAHAGGGAVTAPREPDPAQAAAVARLVAGSRATAPSGDGALLEVRDLVVDHGQLRALHGVDLDIGAGECVALIGANGAGKTTLARAIAGAARSTSGSITLAGRDLAGLRADEITALGVSMCMEGRKIFSTLSVEENLELAAGSAAADVVAERLDAVYELFPILAERRHRSGTAMSGGQQQMLAVARALMSSPRLVVFDEISLGLAPIAVDVLYEALEAVLASGVSTLLVEQHVDRALALASRAYVLSRGRVALAGTTDDVATQESLSGLFLGDVAAAP